MERQQASTHRFRWSRFANTVESTMISPGEQNEGAPRALPVTERELTDALVRVFERQKRGQQPERLRLPADKGAFPKLLCLDINKWIALSQAHHGLPAGTRSVPSLDAIRSASRCGRLVVAPTGTNIQEAGGHKDPAVRRRLAQFIVDLSQNHFLLHEIPLGDREMAGALASLRDEPAGTQSLREELLSRGVGAATIGREFELPEGGPLASVAAEAMLEPEISVAMIAEGMSRELVVDLRAGDAQGADRVRRIRELDARMTVPERRALEIPNLLRAGAAAERLRAIIAGEGLEVDATVRWLLQDGRALRFGDAVPWIDVHATLMLERDRSADNRTDRNDGQDFTFLSAAIPYANFVVTENLWSHLSNATGLGSKYATTVIADLGELPDLLAAEGCLPSD